MSIRRPSSATVLAALAVVIALCGTSLAGYAAGKADGDSVIKKRSLSGNRLKVDTVTGQQVKESSLAKVPAATTADRAASALTADTTPGGAFNALTYKPGWVTHPSYPSRVAGFRKDASGYVHLQGAVKRTTDTGEVVATLPPGFRPSSIVGVSVISSGFYVSAIEIGPDGSIRYFPVLSDYDYVSLEGVSFYADGS